MNRHKPVSGWQLLWRLMRYTPRLYAIDSLFWILIMGLPAVPGLMIREFFNALSQPSRGSDSAWFWVALLLATGLGRIAVLFAGRFTKSQHRFTVSSLVRRNLWEQILNRPGAAPLMVMRRPAQTVSPGEVISYFRDDIDQIEDNVASVSEITGSGLFALGAIALLLTVNARITVLVFLPLIGMVAIVKQAETRIKRYRRAGRQATEQVTGLVGEIFSAVQAIQVAAAEETVLAQLQQVNECRRQMMVRDQILTGLLDSMFQNMVSLGTGLILIVASQSMQAGGEALTVGDFALFVYSLSFVTDFLYFFGQFIALYKHTEVAFERMAGLLPETPIEALVTPTPLYLPDLRGRQPPLPPVPQPHRDEKDCLQELRVENLTYTYPGSSRGIQNISFSLRRGSLTVITGPVGASKTTLLRVLLGLLPRQSGSLFWNDRPILNPAVFFVPPRSAYTPQIPQLFSSSLQENLLLGLEPDPHILDQAIHLAVFEQDLAAMPEGLDTLVGPRGMRLSGGQLQRAAATRMFVRQPELLVFDDLSSALDVETEEKLWQRLFSLRSDSSGDGRAMEWTPTCLVVSHRPSLLRRADQILVLQGGQVAGQGSWEELQQTHPELLHLG